MISESVHRKIRVCVSWLQRYTDRVWYPPLVGVLAALDNLVVIIPNDGILISSSMLTPRRWFLFALCVSIGSTVGALALAWLVEFQGLPWILEIYPGLDESKSWAWAAKFFDRYGLYLVFGVAVTPLMQHPAIILASLASTPLFDLAAVVFVGRFLKFLVMAYVGSHAPRLLTKMWGIRGELKDAGVSVE
ncbi:MAG: VTT domain-containing protein [Bdellovibrionia bacterium]